MVIDMTSRYGSDIDHQSPRSVSRKFLMTARSITCPANKRSNGVAPLNNGLSLGDDSH